MIAHGNKNHMPHISGQCGIRILSSLRWIGDHGGEPPTYTELARMAKANANTAYNAIQALKRAGMVEVRKDPHDQRKRRLTITDTGLNALAEITKEK